MTEHEIDTLLRQLDPTTERQFGGLAGSEPAKDLLRELATRTSPQAERGRRHRPRRVRVGAAVGIAAMVIAVVVVSQSSTPSASAAVNAAAQATADFSSGQLDVEVQIAALPESDSTPSGSSVTASLAFDGPDFDLSNRASLGSEGGPFVSRVVYVGGVEYVQDGSGPWSETQTELSAFVLSPPGQSGEALRLLLAQAEDFSLVDNGDGTAVYSGSLGREVFERVDPGSLPLGVGVVYGRLLPENISVRVEVADGHLTLVVVRLVGDVENYGFVDITVNSAYSELGESQSIEAPR